MVVRPYHILDERMPDHIDLGKMDELDISYFLKDHFRLYEAGYLVVREIYLGYITCNDGFRSESQPRQEHLHLFRSRVLRLIENDKRVIQGPPPHECQR